jgi:hypothetical protein
MNRHETDKPSFDGILDSIRSGEPTRAEIDGAADRVRARLGLGSTSAPGQATSLHIESCAGFQSLIPAYLEGVLPRETAMLLEDHSRECIPCRRALIAARQPRVVPAAQVAERRSPVMRWAAAAAVAAVAVLGTYSAWQVFPMIGADPHLKVLRVDGSLFQVKGNELVPLRAGMSVSAKDVVRTAKDSGALVMMDDGSRIEMRDRTDLAVSQRRNGSTVRLGGGAIIVEASPQGSGHLDVQTDDCLVAVKGTIFAVNHGTKGSRVSVVEGAVRVAADGRENLLKPGDQITTSDNLSAVAVQDEFAWSHDAERYVQLLRELASLQKDLNARVPNPALRYGTKLLDRMQDGTILYAAIPNVTDSLVEAKKVFEEHVAKSAALQAWWNENMSSPEQRQEMDETFERLKAYGSQLGDEIVISLAIDRTGHLRGPIVTSEVKDPAALKKMIVNDLRKAENGREIARRASLSFDGGIMRLEPSHPDSEAAVSVRGPAWTGNPLRAKLQAAYADGASWVFAADLKTMLAMAAEKSAEHLPRSNENLARWDEMGLMDAEYLVFERTEAADGATHRAEISFDQPRRGVAGWLAAPAPLGAADFVSPDAAFAAAAVLKRPEVLFGEVLSWIGPEGVDFESMTVEADTKAVGSLRELAATLGGDIAIALDGPVLPVPSWKVAVEVYDPVRFQAALVQLLDRANERIAAEGHDGRVVVEKQDAGNRTDWVLRFTGSETGLPMRYTFVDGYLVAAPSQVLLDRAIEQRTNGYTLMRSAAFQELLPRDGHVNVSAAVWEHLGPTIGPLAQKFSGVIDSPQAREIQAMAEESRPHLITAYAEDSSIVVGSRSEAGLGSLLGSIISAQHLSALGRVVDQVHHAHGKETPPAP